jgi:D-alanyl-D-alanine carboxypeptidase/D-alanyl-D-alanine-endopeptidase (penicillin-binding protein 4)
MCGISAATAEATLAARAGAQRPALFHNWRQRWRSRAGWAVLCFLLFPLPAVAQLPAELARALEETGLPPTSLALFVQELGSPTPLIAHQADRPMNPASVIKLVTTFAALEALTPAYRWRTEVYADGEEDGGWLKGRLYFKGYGDPRITLETLWLWLRELRARGLRNIDGDVVLDRSHFDLPPEDPAAFDGKPLRPYNVGPDALLLNFRTQRLHILPQSGRLHVRLEAAAGLALDNRLRPVAGPCGDWKNNIAATVEKTRRGVLLRLGGEYPLSCGEQSAHFALFDADTQAELLLNSLWQELGGRLRGRVKAGTVADGARLMARFESAPLAEVVRDINKFSNNVMARQVYLTLGAELFGAPATPEKAALAVKTVLASRGLDFVELQPGNGAGLDRGTRITARHLAALLGAARASLWYPEFAASLPLVGLDGTVRHRLAGQPVAGQARLKSGSLDDVRALAGYSRDAKGREMIVVCLINDPQAARARPFQDSLLAWLFARP